MTSNSSASFLLLMVALFKNIFFPAKSGIKGGKGDTLVLRNQTKPEGVVPVVRVVPAAIGNPRILLYPHYLV